MQLSVWRMWQEGIHCIMMELMRRDLEWQGLILWAMLSFSLLKRAGTI